ncbi:TylF/MycF/NovP-related O-methyltransferase [Aeromonas caviae]
MYLDLLSKVLTNKIYEPDSPKATPDEVDEIKKTLDLLMNDGINLNISAEDLTQILQYTKRSRNIHTYVSIDALNNIRDAITITNEKKIVGDVLDCGVLRGGTSIYMAGVLKSLNSSRKVYVADSFSGLPVPSTQDGIFANHFWYRFSKALPIYNLDCLASIDDVKENFNRYGLLDDNIIFMPGWFEDTLPSLSAANVKFSVVKIDADWYSSTKDVLDNVYHLISDGGFIIIDDYNLPGCKLAVDEFREKNGISKPLQIADEVAGVFFWIK